MMICAAILVGVIIAMVLEKDINVPMQMSAIIGGLLCVLTGCLNEKQAYQGIDWTTIFLFAGMLPLAGAMDKSGAGKVIADFVVGLMGDAPSAVVIVAAMFALSCGLTQFMSNTAAAALLAPIAISIAQSVGVFAVPGRHGDRYRRILRVHDAGCNAAEHARSWTWSVQIHGLCQGRTSACLYLADRLPCRHPACMAVLID